MKEVMTVNAALMHKDTMSAANLLDNTALFHKLVEAEKEKAVRLAYNLVGDLAAAEDIAQDAFIAAYEGLSSFRAESSLRTWFYKILVRQAGRYRRWRGVRERFGGAFGGEVDDIEARANPLSRLPEADAEASELRSAIGKSMAGLSPGQREVFSLVHLQGFTAEEAAEILGKAPGTVKSHLHRAVKYLRKDLAFLSEKSDD